MPARIFVAASLLLGSWGAIAFATDPPATGPATRPSTQPTKLKDGTVVWECSDEEYAVYRALLTELYVKHKATALTGEGSKIGGIGPVINQVVLADRTLDARILADKPMPDDEDPLHEDFGKVEALNPGPPEMGKAFRAANSRPAKLDAGRLAFTGLQVIVIAQDDYRYPMRPESTEPYIYEKYPRCQGVTLLSRPAFSADGQQAVLTESTNRATLFGHGMIYLLKKEKDGWKVVAGKMTWIS